MAKRIGIVVAVVLLGLAGYYVYTRYAAANRLRDGEVTSDDVRDSDGNAARATPSRSDSASTVNTEPARTAQANTQSASLAELQGQNAAAVSNPGGAPATDSQSPNAPNGVAFAGTGRFQVYRQGNLTWRINTDNGTTCILFATEEEWTKPVVYNHGCGNS